MFCVHTAFGFKKFGANNILSHENWEVTKNVVKTFCLKQFSLKIFLSRRNSKETKRKLMDEQRDGGMRTLSDKVTS